MNRITISDVPAETFKKLEKAAAALNESVEQFLRREIDVILAEGSWQIGSRSAHEAVKKARANLEQDPLSVSAEDIIEAIRQDRR